MQGRGKRYVGKGELGDAGGVGAIHRGLETVCRAGESTMQGRGAMTSEQWERGVVRRGLGSSTQGRGKRYAGKGER
jgi:hypothetical protein